MRCIREILNTWSEFHQNELEWDEFDVRRKAELPDLSYDAYISSGGPGSPLDGIGTDWEAAYFNWISALEAWNNDPQKIDKKYVFFICHSFQLACRHFRVGHVSKRKSTAFGVFPVHVTPAGQTDPLFSGLKDPFYVVDSRDWQVIDPDWTRIEALNARILCIEKYRPHVPYSQAIMGMRFNPWMAGTQFHPEADAIGMSLYLQRPDKKEIVIEQHGEEKWTSMVQQLNDPDKIMWTYAHLLPNFLDGMVRQRRQTGSWWVKLMNQ